MTLRGLLFGVLGVGVVGCSALIGLSDYSFDGMLNPDATNGDTLPPFDGSDPCANPNKPEVAVQGDITDATTWTCDRNYLLDGQVYVKSGASLTIQAGTTVLGRRGQTTEFGKVSILVIQPGGKIFAVGTRDKPIVFTSKSAGKKEPGDWGGLVLLGNAKINQGTANIEGIVAGGTMGDVATGEEGKYGGNDDDDSSGELKYVRVEYGGFKISNNNEINGVTFGGVGRKTKVDYVEVRNTLDDCFEFFGGTVNASHLICHLNQDDGIDWDYGYRGKIQFAMVQQDPDFYDDMHAIEADNEATAPFDKMPFSEPTLYNVTAAGAHKIVDRPDGKAAGFRFGMLLRRKTKVHIFNSIFAGFEGGHDIRDAIMGAPASDYEMKNIIFFNNVHSIHGGLGNIAFPEQADGSVPFRDNDNGWDETAMFNAGTGNSTMDPKLIAPTDIANPNLRPGAEISSGSVLPPGNDDFFVPAPYVGAFKDANDQWATGAWVAWGR